MGMTSPMSAREDTPSRLVRSGAKHYMYNDVFCVKVGFLLSYSLGPGCHANDPRCKPTVQSATTAGAVTPGGSTPASATSMYIRAIGRTRERATRTRLMQLAREVAARVPCERLGPTVKPTIQSTTTAGAVTPGGSTVDPRVGYVHPRHRSDPRAGFTHTAHAVCA